MFVTVKINEDLSPGTMVCHDTGDTWRKATSSDVAPLGVLKGATFLDDDSARWAWSSYRALVSLGPGQALPSKVDG